MVIYEMVIISAGCELQSGRSLYGHVDGRSHLLRPVSLLKIFVNLYTVHRRTIEKLCRIAD